MTEFMYVIVCSNTALERTAIGVHSMHWNVRVTGTVYCILDRIWYCTGILGRRRDTGILVLYTGYGTVLVYCILDMVLLGRRRRKFWSF